MTNNGQSSSRPRRAAAIKADERIQLIRQDEPNENLHRNSPKTISSRSNQESVENLIEQIERKLQFDDDEEQQQQETPIEKEISSDRLLEQCTELHDRLAYAPNAKLIRFLTELIILLSGDRDPWLIAALIVGVQAIGFRYNALCIYQRKKR